MNPRPGPTNERWAVRRVPPELERAYVDGGWWTADTFGALVARQLAAYPAATITIWSRARPWQGRYADVEQEARRLVTLLRERGVQPGDAVAFQLPNWREAVVSFAALALGGYVVVPIVHIYGRKEVAFILEQSGAVAYISPLAYGHVDNRDIVDTAAPALVVAGGECEPALASVADEVRRGWPLYLASDAGAPAPPIPAAGNWDALLARASTENPDRAVRDGLVAGHDLFFIYTSGTTGLPKAARLSHMRWLGVGDGMSAIAEYGPDDVIGCVLPSPSRND